jgi:hypothetical protein
MAKEKKTMKAKSEMPTEITKKNTGDVVERIEKELKKFDDKAFNVYFYVIDTKGVPSGSLLYIYKVAYELHSLGYNVTMLHNENEFVGISQWADSKYAELPHSKVSDRQVTLSASDFLIIPEIYTDIMSQTRDIPCKRVMLVQNFDYLTKIIPVGVHPYEYGITDAIVNTKTTEKLIKNNLPMIKTHVLSPGISDTLFRKNDKPKKMIVNFVVKNGDDASRVVKPFFWKYPQLKWVTFAQLSNLPQEIFADALRDAAITIVIDDTMSFGYAALEALKTGSIVICKIPDNIPDWMLDNGELSNSIVWVDNLDEIPDLIANLVAMWVRDDVPEELYNEMEKAAEKHTTSVMKEDVEKVFTEELFVARKKEIQDALDKVVSETSKNNEKSE